MNHKVDRLTPKEREELYGDIDRYLSERRKRSSFFSTLFSLKKKKSADKPGECDSSEISGKTADNVPIEAVNYAIRNNYIKQDKKQGDAPIRDGAGGHYTGSVGSNDSYSGDAESVSAVSGPECLEGLEGPEGSSAGTTAATGAVPVDIDSISMGQSAGKSMDKDNASYTAGVDAGRQDKGHSRIIRESETMQSLTGIQEEAGQDKKGQPADSADGCVNGQKPQDFNDSYEEIQEGEQHSRKGFWASLLCFFGKQGSEVIEMRDEYEQKENAYKQDIKDIAKFAHSVLMRLPMDHISEVKQTEQFLQYKQILDKHGLIKK